MGSAFRGILAVCFAAASPAEPPAEVEARPAVLTDLVYAQRDDQTLKTDVYLPPGPGPFPGVVLLHGGGWSLGDKRQMADQGRVLASAGFVAVSIEYRRAPWAKFPAQFEDCCEAVRWLRREAKRFEMDPDRIAAWGYSSGGHLACLLGVRGVAGKASSSDEGARQIRLRAVVAGGAVCDFLRHALQGQPPPRGESETAP